MPTLYVRGLPEELVRGAKALAAQRGVTLRAFIADTLRAAVHDAPTTTATDGIVDELSDDLAWYEDNRELLAERYPGEFLAIVDQQVVDRDQDLGALATRTLRRYGNRPVLMPDTRRKRRIVHLRSPRTGTG